MAGIAFVDAMVDFKVFFSTPPVPSYSSPSCRKHSFSWGRGNGLFLLLHSPSFSCNTSSIPLILGLTTPRFKVTGVEISFTFSRLSSSFKISQELSLGCFVSCGVTSGLTIHAGSKKSRSFTEGINSSESCSSLTESNGLKTSEYGSRTSYPWDIVGNL